MNDFEHNFFGHESKRSYFSSFSKSHNYFEVFRICLGCGEMWKLMKYLLANFDLLILFCFEKKYVCRTERCDADTPGCAVRAGDEKCQLRNATHCEQDLLEGPNGTSDNFLCLSIVRLIEFANKQCGVANSWVPGPILDVGDRRHPNGENEEPEAPQGKKILPNLYTQWFDNPIRI